MEISNVSSSPPPIGGGPGQDDLGKEAFLQLLTAQLQHQDPLNPASDVEFISQLTQFASLEQLRNVNDNLNIIELYQLSLNNSSAMNILGKSLKIETNQIEHESAGQTHEFFYPGLASAESTQIRIKDEDGNIVYEQTLPGGANGEQSFTWHGVDDVGNDVPAGNYFAEVIYEGADGSDIPAPIFQMKQADGLAYENGMIYILVGDLRLPINGVSEVYENGSAIGPRGGPMIPAMNPYTPYTQMNYFGR